jgi:hypothetical protein
MNLMAFDSLPQSSSAPRGSRAEQFLGIREAGFAGVQFAKPASQEELAICHSLKLGFAGSGRVNVPSETLALADELAGAGYDCATLHVGWGIEDDDEAFRLIESILDASHQTGFPLYVETHRATICQDMWRTVGFVKRFPEMRFNGDFSHWYAGQEMVYGGFEKKFKFIEPVLERVRFIHGRIADPGCIQAAVREGTTYLAHFELLWTACFRSFIEQASGDSFICFAPELLGAGNYYARSVNGAELTDRWEESLLLNRIAAKCFLSAQREVA